MLSVILYGATQSLVILDAECRGTIGTASLLAVDGAKLISPNQGTLTEGEDSVHLTSSLRWVVWQKSKVYFQF